MNSNSWHHIPMLLGHGRNGEFELFCAPTVKGDKCQAWHLGLCEEVNNGIHVKELKIQCAGEKQSGSPRRKPGFEDKYERSFSRQLTDFRKLFAAFVAYFLWPDLKYITYYLLNVFSIPADLPILLSQ